MEGAVASILLQLPFYKHVFGWVGGHEAGDRPAIYSFVLSKCCSPMRSATASEGLTTTYTIPMYMRRASQRHKIALTVSLHDHKG